MKNPEWIGGWIVGLAGSLASADVITQTVNYDFPFDGNPSLMFEGFDDQGGTLRLDRMTFDWDLNWSVDLKLENTGPTPVNPGDFVITMEHYTIHQLGIGEAPAYGPGGVFFSVEDVGLGAFEDTRGQSNIYTGTLSESYQRSLEFTAATDPAFIEVMSQPGPIETIYGGFGVLMFYWVNEPQGWDPPSGPDGEPIYPVDDAVWVTLEQTRHFGTVTLTYEYSLAPEPATFGMAAALGLAVLRRRPLRSCNC